MYVYISYVCRRWWYLRNSKAGNGETRNNIRLEQVEVVMSTPLKYREKILSSKNPFVLERLSFELAKRVVGKESFFESVLQFMDGAGFRRWHHLVHLHASYSNNIFFCTRRRIHQEKKGKKKEEEEDASFFFFFWKNCGRMNDNMRFGPKFYYVVVVGGVGAVIQLRKDATRNNNRSVPSDLRRWFTSQLYESFYTNILV